MVLTGFWDVTEKLVVKTRIFFFDLSRFFFTFVLPFEEGSEQCRDATRQRQKGGTYTSFASGEGSGKYLALLFVPTH